MRERFLFVLFGIFLLSVFFHFSIRFIEGQTPSPGDVAPLTEGASRIIILWPNPEASKPNLQLYTFPYITIPVPNLSQTPASNYAGNPIFSGPIIPGNGEYCPVDGLVPQGSSCKCIDNNAIACPAPNGAMSSCPPSSSGKPTFAMPLDGKFYCMEIYGPGLFEPMPPIPSGCFAACIAKPVVYLYPTEPTSVSVAVKAQGEVFVSDPHYPAGGWKDVLAHPDGTLWYQGKKYRELFYETSVTKTVSMPDTGIVIAMKDLERTLKDATTKLGLVGIEQDEFLEFWIPTLQRLKSPYIFFSILPPDVKESYDHLDITPAPNTRIEFIAYFKALTKPVAVAPLELPVTPPERIGFTEVEWGGTIGY